MDFMTPEQRHRNMHNIKQKNTVPEKILMQALRQNKIYFSTHVKELPGKPDIVFRRKKVAVFVDSDFWHGRANLPKSNIEFWSKKFEYNRNHDAEVNEKLNSSGWKVLRFTDKQVKKNLDYCLNSIFCAIEKCTERETNETE